MAPGHPDGAITVHLGFGRGVQAGRVAQGVGFDAYQIRHVGCAAVCLQA